MRTVFVLFDSLNRLALECYGGSLKTPNFSKFAERAVTFDNHYTGSLPCMPARREIHTGRHNFLHRSWGPLEPFDLSCPEILKVDGTYTHLVTDHYHYWEDGGLTYHNRYSSWTFCAAKSGILIGHWLNRQWENLRKNIMNSRLICQAPGQGDCKA